MTYDQPPSPSLDSVEVAWERAARRLFDLRCEDGGWEGEVVWCPMLPAQYVIVSHLVKRDIPEPRREGILQQFRHTRHADGLWGMHPESPPYLFVTTLVYVAARLLGVPASDPLLAPGLEFIRSGKGVTAIPSWGKFWLALVNLFDWKGVPPILPELWLAPSKLFLHPSRYYCHTRQIYAPMAFLYGRKFAAPPSPLGEELRRELYPGGYGNFDFRASRGRLREEEICSPPGRRLKLFYAIGFLFESIPWKPLRGAAEKKIVDLIEFDAKTSDGAFLSPVSGLLDLLVLHIGRGDSEQLDELFTKLDGWIWEDETRGLRIAGARSKSWDTAFALQALARPATLDRLGLNEAVSAARRSLASEQILTSPEESERHYRTRPEGGFCFGHASHGWPVSDCTAEALVALLQSPKPEVISDERVKMATRFILGCRNPDGGFGTYEARRTRSTLDWLNPAEMFGNSMVEHTWVECTASSLEGLLATRLYLPDPELVDDPVRQAEAWLRSHQRSDGSWLGVWGVCFLYGTLFGIRGLVAAGAKPDDSALLAACRWIASKQHTDGGWGEHHEASYREEWVDHPISHCTQTAWALTALILSGSRDYEDVIERGIGFLVSQIDESGNWPEERAAGVFFKSAVLDYRLYHRYFPLRALTLYLERKVTEPVL